MFHSYWRTLLMCCLDPQLLASPFRRGSTDYSMTGNLLVSILGGNQEWIFSKGEFRTPRLLLWICPESWELWGWTWLLSFEHDGWVHELYSRGLRHWNIHLLQLFRGRDLYNESIGISSRISRVISEKPEENIHHWSSQRIHIRPSPVHIAGIHWRVCELVIELL